MLNLVYFFRICSFNLQVVFNNCSQTIQYLWFNTVLWMNMHLQLPTGIHWFTTNFTVLMVYPISLEKFYKMYLMFISIVTFVTLTIHSSLSGPHTRIVVAFFILAVLSSISSSSSVFVVLYTNQQSIILCAQGAGWSHVGWVGRMRAV